jgi:hypothetical protein
MAMLVARVGQNMSTPVRHPTVPSDAG